MSKFYKWVATLVISILIVLSFTNTAVAEPTAPGITNQVVEVPVPVVELSPKEKIIKEFTDAPYMLKIALSESGYKGEPCVRNTNSASSAQGCFHILKGTFADPRYGCKGDRMNVDDNIDCARKILTVDGTRPWNASKHMWSK